MQRFVHVLPLLLAGVACAQPPAFEVASVKAHRTAVAEEGTSIDGVPGRLTMRNVNLISCLALAHALKQYQISGPAFLGTEKYDILAKASGPARMDQLRPMLQTLLAERFRLRVHRETRVLPVYLLVSAKSGPKLHKAEPGGNTDMRGENGSFVFRNTSMEQFADDLSELSRVDRPVLNRTGISGNFDFNLTFGDSREEMKRVLNEGDGASIFTLIQEQLGLKLEAKKGRVEMLVVDHAEKIPVEN